MNGDIAQAAAYRRADEGEQERFIPGHRYCWKCSTYKPLESIAPAIGGRCWDCIHAPARSRAATVAVRCISRGHHKAAVMVMALALDEQARAEGLDVPSVAAATRADQRHGFRERLVDFLWLTDPEWVVT